MTVPWEKTVTEAEARGATIKRLKGAYYVVAPSGRRLSAAIGSLDVAKTTLENMHRRATRRHRECICCGAGFMSEGNHNRMCPKCRGADDGDWFGCGVVA